MPCTTGVCGVLPVMRIQPAPGHETPGFLCECRCSPGHHEPEERCPQHRNGKGGTRTPTPSLTKLLPGSPSRLSGKVRRGSDPYLLRQHSLPPLQQVVAARLSSKPATSASQKPAAVRLVASLGKGFQEPKTADKNAHSRKRRRVVLRPPPEQAILYFIRNSRPSIGPKSWDFGRVEAAVLRLAVRDAPGVQTTVGAVVVRLTCRCPTAACLPAWFRVCHRSSSSSKPRRWCLHRCKTLPGRPSSAPRSVAAELLGMVAVRPATTPSSRKHQPAS